jgi:hypothetical protein
MPNTPSNSKILDLDLIDPNDSISDVYYSLDDALEVAKEFPELEKGVLAILKEDYNITE